MTADEWRRSWKLHPGSGDVLQEPPVHVARVVRDAVRVAEDEPGALVQLRPLPLLLVLEPAPDGERRGALAAQVDGPAAGAGLGRPEPGHALAADAERLPDRQRPCLPIDVGPAEA